MKDHSFNELATYFAEDSFILRLLIFAAPIEEGYYFIEKIVQHVILFQLKVALIPEQFCSGPKDLRHKFIYR